MPNILDANGLQTMTRAELLAFYNGAFQSIYGTNINLDSSTPDGQLIGILVQANLDTLNLMQAVYTSFDPDQAIGTVLDQRLAINGIQRQAGTYTVTPITIVQSQSVNLYGLDQTKYPPYTVADGAGNQWQLMSTVLGSTVGTHVYNFQAANPGAVQTIPNTITIPVTILLGITSVNNPTTWSTLGVNEETDGSVKVRRQKSVALSSQGYFQGLLAALTNINGVTSAFVFENTSNSTNADGVPGHSIWVIVAGTGSAASIANAIYTKRSAGCGMYGQQRYTITQADGSLFQVFWDTVTASNAFIFFTASSIDGVTAPNISAIRTALASNLHPGVNQRLDINEIGTYAQAIDPNVLVTAAALTTASQQQLNFATVPASGSFVIAFNGSNSASINWNDSTAAIQTKIQAVPGCSQVTVTGSIASQVLTFSFGATPPALFTIASSTLANSVPAAVGLGWAYQTSTVLTPPSKANQFLVSSANIVILPMQLAPSVASVPRGGNAATLAAYGGYGTYVYSFQTNSSGGTVNSSTGAYLSGSTAGIDTLLATDSFGNTATCAINVT